MPAKTNKDSHLHYLQHPRRDETQRRRVIKPGFLIVGHFPKYTYYTNKHSDSQVPDNTNLFGLIQTFRPRFRASSTKEDFPHNRDAEMSQREMRKQTITD